MASLKTKYEFDRWSASVVGVAVATINEALAGPTFRQDILYSEHRLQIAREALTRRPELLGQLAGLAATDAALAIETATRALEELSAADPLLFQSSRAPKTQVCAWVRRAYPHADAASIRAEIDYMQDQLAWNRRYQCQHILLERGEDVAAIGEQIERAYPGDR